MNVKRTKLCLCRSLLLMTGLLFAVASFAQSQMESAPFLGNDERLFWQRSEDRNRGTAALYDNLGLASYEAMEAFVEYIPL